MYDLDEMTSRMDELKSQMMREECFAKLQEFIFYYNHDKSGENENWTGKAAVIELAAQISKVIEEESRYIGEYYALHSDYNHIVGSEMTGNAHTHAHTDGVHMHSHGDLTHSHN